MSPGCKITAALATVNMELQDVKLSSHPKLSLCSCSANITYEPELKTHLGARTHTKIAGVNKYWVHFIVLYPWTIARFISKPGITDSRVGAPVSSFRKQWCIIAFSDRSVDNLSFKVASVQMQHCWRHHKTEINLTSRSLVSMSNTVTSSLSKSRSLFQITVPKSLFQLSWYHEPDGGWHVPPGPIGRISRFICTFQCLTLVLAWRSFLWAAWQRNRAKQWNPFFYHKALTKVQTTTTIRQLPKQILVLR